MATGEVFAVTYRCGNCGEEWDDTYGERTRVVDREEETRVVVSDLDCGEFACDCCGPVACPTCKLLEHVGVTSREPL